MPTLRSHHIVAIGLIFSASLLLSGLCITTEAAENTDATLQVLNRDIPHLLTEAAIPSVSIAQIKQGRIALTAAYGSQSQGTPATTETLYNIASLTKPLTAEVILRMASKNVISLDEPMYSYWTDPDIANDERRKLLTPRLALSHRTGFPNWRDKKDGLKFVNEPGTVWGYSGEGYQYVARFAEKKTDKSFEELAQTYLFDPARMKSTSYIGKPWFEGRIAIPTSAAGEPLKPEIGTHYNAADLVYTTARDYAVFMVAVLKNRSLSSIIAKERNRIQVSMMQQTCQGAKAESCPHETGYGLGWQILDFKDETLMMHTGKDDGIFTFAYLNRTTGDGAVIFTNGEDGYKIILPILERLHTSPMYIRFLQGQMK
ncbi:serine hydrolase domain-containing protein [Glaciimonas soli]|uniref:Serine hydrolase n=1 Tax=Glaciimonas soli TaxID=2590999 RepID=A0A843YXU7_9BURK|nr:serine hydrolase domain-containing protein [Glaciimonas soli]MQR02593.1 serine hydrolase [Glaciimonas soli]